MLENPIVSKIPSSFYNGIGKKVNSEQAAKLVDSLGYKEFPNMSKFYDSIFIDGKSLKNIFKETLKEGEIFNMDKLGDGSSAMTARDYEEKRQMDDILAKTMANRNSVIQIAKPDADLNNLKPEHLSVVNPEIEYGFFSRLWNSVKNIFGFGRTESEENTQERYLNMAAGKYSDYENKICNEQVRGKIQKVVIEEKAEYEKIVLEDDKTFYKDPFKDFVKLYNNEKSDKENLNNFLVAAGENLELKTMGTRIDTRVAFARLYMFSKGHNMEDVFANDEAAIEKKKQAGKEIMELFHNKDFKAVKEVMTKIAADGAKWFAKEENHINFDFTNDAAIADNLSTTQYKAVNSMAKDLEQIFFSSRGGAYTKPVREQVSDKIFNDYQNRIQSSMWAKVLCDERINGVILTKEYSNANKDNKKLEIGDKISASSLGYLCAANEVKDKYGVNLAKIPSVAIPMSIGNVMSSAGMFYINADQTKKKHLDCQILCGIKPEVSTELKALIEDTKVLINKATKIEALRQLNEETGKEKETEKQAEPKKAGEKRNSI